MASENPLNQLGLKKDLAAYLHSIGALKDFASAYYKAAIIHLHPDRGGNTQLASSINDAYDEIKRADKRQIGKWIEEMSDVGELEQLLGGMVEQVAFAQKFEERCNDRMQELANENRKLSQQYQQMLSGCKQAAKDAQAAQKLAEIEKESYEKLSRDAASLIKGLKQTSVGQLQEEIDALRLLFDDGIKRDYYPDIVQRFQSGFVHRLYEKFSGEKRPFYVITDVYGEKKERYKEVLSPIKISLNELVLCHVESFLCNRISTKEYCTLPSYGFDYVVMVASTKNGTHSDLGYVNRHDDHHSDVEMWTLTYYNRRGGKLKVKNCED